MCPRAQPSPLPEPPEAGGAGSVTGTHVTAAVAEPTRNRVAGGGEPGRGARLQEGESAAEAGAGGREGREITLVIRKQGIPLASDTILNFFFFN